MQRVASPCRRAEGSAFVAVAGVEMAESLYIREKRQWGNDYRVRFETIRRQIPESSISTSRRDRREACGSSALLRPTRSISKAT
jgi:hypothetical protein